MSARTSSLIVGLDHLLVGVADLPRSREDYTQLLGAAPVTATLDDDRSVVVFATGNVALCLVEADRQPGLERLCFRVSDGGQLRRRCQRVGIGLAEASAPDPLAVLSGDGGAAIDVAVAATTRGLPCAFVQRDRAVASGPGHQVTGLDHLVLSSTRATDTGFLLAAQLGLDMRMDRLRPEWGLRMMFFRCGDLILEVIEPLDSAQDDARDTRIDSFYGLSWRVLDAHSARAELVASNFEVSEVRAGRKPGTEVFTVRQGTGGIATLMLQPPPR